MRIYLQNLSLFLILMLSVAAAAGQTAAPAEYLNNQTAVFVPDAENQAAPAVKSNRGKPVCDQSPALAYENLSAFVNDSDSRRTGECVVVENVPVFSGIKTAEDEFGNRKGLFYLETASQTDVGDTLVSSNSLAEHLGAFLKNPAAKSLRVTVVLVELRSDFDVFRAPFAVTVEGLDDKNEVVWTAAGANPARLKFQI